MGDGPTSFFWSLIQTDRIFESELQATSLTEYPQLTLPSKMVLFHGSLRLNSPCLRPFLSKSTTSCRPSFPAPPPSKPNLWVETIKFPEGLHASVCSNPATASDVDCRTASRLYTLKIRLLVPLWAFVLDKAETTKYAPSPRQLIREIPSSSGLEPMLSRLVATWAAAFPSVPWNWVCLEPQPTLIGGSGGARVKNRLEFFVVCHYLHRIPQYVREPQKEHRKLMSSTSTCCRLKPPSESPLVVFADDVPVIKANKDWSGPHVAVRIPKSIDPTVSTCGIWSMKYFTILSKDARSGHRLVVKQ